MYSEIPYFQKIQMKQLEIMCELDRVCRKNNINYYIVGGTLIGAVRQGGFLPWDHDIDTFMLWEDVQKLIEHQADFKENYFIQTRESDPEFGITIARLRDSSTSCFTPDELNINCNHGLYVDIYILYPYPDSKIKAHSLILKSFVYRILSNGRVPKNHGKAIKLISSLLLKRYQGEKRKKRIEMIENELKHNGGSKFLATFYAVDTTPFRALQYKREWFSKPSEIEFEGKKLWCPTNYDGYLTTRYGPDYMTPPAKLPKIQNEFIFASPTEPYTDYKDVYY